MKGIVFNLLERSVEEQFGSEVWDQLLDRAGLDGAYTSLGSYPDEQLYQLVGAASEILGLSQSAVVQWFGRSAVPLMVERFPGFFAPHKSTRDFLLTLNSVIHPEVRKLFPGADAPDFLYDTSSPDTLIMNYRSKRRLCDFALGLIEGTAAHYGEVANHVHSVCMKNGAPMCRFELSFVPSNQGRTCE